MPNSVTSIGYYAFSGCDGLTSVNIGNGVKSIGEDFAYCKELTDVYCYADKIPSAEAGAFSYSNIWNATLHVPAASIEQYKTASPWINFGTIVPLTDEDAIAEVEAVLS
ncbi:MAG: leucine-rich repeat protein [Bacteroidaceae bacterium]|nr:leucine-rich repeat protein [Bacteroidaceae bacterium]